MERLVIILTYNVTIQMKSLWHTDFHRVLIISQDFTNWSRYEISGNFFTGRFQYFLFKYF